MFSWFPFDQDALLQGLIKKGICIRGKLQVKPIRLKNQGHLNTAAWSVSLQSLRPIYIHWKLRFARPVWWHRHKVTPADELFSCSFKFWSLSGTRSKRHRCVCCEPHVKLTLSQKFAIFLPSEVPLPALTSECIFSPFHFIQLHNTLRGKGKNTEVWQHDKDYLNFTKAHVQTGKTYIDLDLHFCFSSRSLNRIRPAAGIAPHGTWP